MDNLSGRQAEILDFIAQHCERTGYPPTVREIGDGVGLASPSTVHAHLSKLAECGYLRRDPSKPRAMDARRGRTAAVPAASVRDRGAGLRPFGGRCRRGPAALGRRASRGLGADAVRGRLRLAGHG